MSYGPAPPSTLRTRTGGDGRAAPHRPADRMPAPPPPRPVVDTRCAAGAFDRGGGRHPDRNRDLGHPLPVRFDARPEIPLFRLVPASGGGID